MELSKDFFLKQPWDHQRVAVEKARYRNSFAFFFSMGTGKTATCINTLRCVYRERGPLRTLILAPPIVLENWRREIGVFSNIPPENVEVLTGPGKKRLKTLQETKAHIIITNYETVLLKGMLDALLSWSPEVLVCDESHKCKNIQAKRTKAIIKIADCADYRYLLSGTPVLNTLMDLYPQYRIMEGPRTFGVGNFYAFRGKYFRDVNAGMPKDKYFPNWKPLKGAEDRIRSYIEDSSLSADKSECLDLPPLVKKEIHVPMSKEQEKVYHDIREDFVAYMDDKACVATLAITKALRMQQIVSGYVPVQSLDGEKHIVKIKDNPRALALKELLEDITPAHKVLVWACFKENYETIREVCKALKIDYCEVHGDIKDKDAEVDRLNNDPECRVLIGHPGSGGIGINLVEASYSIFYSRGFNLEYDLQAEARNYRGGSEKHACITRIDLVTPNTIDEQVLKALACKQQIGEKVLHQIAKEI